MNISFSFFFYLSIPQFLESSLCAENVLNEKDSDEYTYMDSYLPFNSKSTSTISRYQAKYPESLHDVLMQLE